MEGEVLSPVPFPVTASSFPCASQGCEERWDEGLASSGHWAVEGGNFTMAKAFEDGQERLWKGPSSHIHSDSGKHKDFQRWSFLEETPAAVSAALLTFSMRLSQKS